MRKKLRREMGDGFGNHPFTPHIIDLIRIEIEVGVRGDMDSASYGLNDVIFEELFAQ